MRGIRCLFSLFLVLCLALPAWAGKGGPGYMGGSGTVVVEEPPAPAPAPEPTVDEPPADTGDDGGLPSTVEGPLNDKKSSSGKLYGDLYRILRQTGYVGDKKLVPQVNATGEPVLTDGVQLFVDAVNTGVLTDPIVGGEPVLTVTDPDGTKTYADYGWFAADNNDDGVGDTAVQSPFPAQCVQPVASYERWGDISSKSKLTKNRLPLVITYDATWNRSECAVGQVDGTVTVDASGAVVIPTNVYFIEPCDKDADGNPIPAPKCQWTDPVNQLVTYPDGVYWTDLVQEVGFGRLNISRAPEAVLQAAFDEAVNNLNDPNTIAIEMDAAGRLLLTKNVYDPLRVDTTTGLPLLIGTTKKAIDSPLENVALYTKLLKDGHLVTPGDERAPIDKSKNGGIPIWKMLELEDGPGAKALRPTIDIAKLRAWGMGDLVNVSEVSYLTYYVCLNDAGAEVPCLIWGSDPNPEVTEPVLVGNPAAVSRELKTVLASAGCPNSGDVNNPYVCEGPFTGIMTYDGGTPSPADLNFSAAFLAAAADKTGEISVDMVVYLNSILGINLVLGYSEYDADGVPTADAIDYSKSPVYFNYRDAAGYGRNATFGARGQVVTAGGTGSASTYDGKVKVLQGASPTWTETLVPILSAERDGDLTLGNGLTIFDNLGLGANAFPDGTVAADNILGFTQQSDDDLSVIRFIHTFQIPSLR